MRWRAVGNAQRGASWKRTLACPRIIDVFTLQIVCLVSCAGEGATEGAADWLMFENPNPP
jgi:hypothetical protein